MYWRCNCLFASEDGLDHYDNATNNRPLSEALTGYLFRQPDLPKYEILESWHNMMRNFNARKLTYESDKLAAIAGITQMFQGFLNDKPVCGLWQDHLHSGLLWRMTSVHGEQDSEAVQTLNIPSWSWAKMRGELEWRDQMGDPCSEIHKVLVSWTSSPLTSKVQDALILGRGRMLQITDIQTDADDTCKCQTRSVCVKNSNGLEKYFQLIEWRIDGCLVDLCDETYCLPVKRYKRADYRGFSDPDEMAMWGLIVKPRMKASHPHTYRRIGVVGFQKFSQEFLNCTVKKEFHLV